MRRISSTEYDTVSLRRLEHIKLAKEEFNIHVTNDHGYAPLVVSTFRSFPHS
jgi:hypothetical protein